MESRLQWLPVEHYLANVGTSVQFFFIFLLFLYLIIIIPCVIHTSNLQTRLPRVSLSINSFSLDIPLARMLSEHDHFNIFVIILDRIYVNSNIRLAKNSELLSPFSPFAFHCNISVFFFLNTPDSDTIYPDLVSNTGSSLTPSRPLPLPQSLRSLP